MSIGDWALIATFALIGGCIGLWVALRILASHGVVERREEKPEPRLVQHEGEWWWLDHSRDKWGDWEPYLRREIIKNGWLCSQMRTFHGYE